MVDEKIGPFDLLSKAWYNLRLSVRCPARVPTWDAIILTAASPEQAELYQWHLDRAKQQGRIEASTIVLAVPDPQGRRIGSGGATLSALRSLAHHLVSNRSEANSSSPFSEHPSGGASIHLKLLKMSILLIHAGGDSKRVPWANPIGKAFLPLPFLAEDDPDGPVPSLFDHILAISSCAVQNFKFAGGLLIMTGDVLPCFDFSDIHLPENGACVVVVPTSLDIAANHGVIVASSVDGKGDLCHGISHLGQRHLKLEIVVDLLQKPSQQALVDRGALRSKDTALLDTGIFVIRGEAWRDLSSLAVEDPNPVMELINSAQELSLYEELAGAWVPARHGWLKTRPLGKKLIGALGSQPLFCYCAQELSFFHFGTSLEVLNHFAKGAECMGRRHLSVFTENTSCSLAPSAVIVSSEINGTVFVGEHSLVFDCTLGDGVHIGHGCVIVGIHEKGNVSESSCCQPIEQASFVLPDGHCLWEVPLRGTESRVALCCGIGDNPKSALTNGGTFCGKLLKEFICEKGFQEEDLWPYQSNEWKDLWNAKLFPIMLPGHGISFAMWLMGVFKEDSDVFMSNWQSSERISLAELHGRIDFKRLCYEHSNHHSKLAKGLAKASLESGFLERNLFRLCAQIASEDDPSNLCKELLALCPDLTNVGILQVPFSRAYQAQVDLCRACGEDVAADAFENHVWHSVAAETSSAVRKWDSFESASQNPLLENFIQPYIDFHVRKSRVELPVRIDFVGGWSDTPPWSLEQTGNVLNMAVLLEDCVPIGAEVIVTSAAGISIVDDAGNSLTIKDPAEITTPFQVDDSFRLVKSALLVTGLANSSVRWIGGLEIKTWANVPRGSGLGTSSILAAAVVKGLLQIMGGDLSNENVASLVLILEQLMGTGGGWQDQIGGLYPGIKCTTSFPGDSLKLKVEPVRVSSQLKRELEERMLVVFTGQVRMAHQVLQNVVRRYLQRDAILISTIKRLAQLALLGQKTLADGNLENLGRIMSEAWQLHQELDPYCSNTFVDTLFLQVADLASGYKLVGAGGGGFAMLMAKNREAGLNMKEVLKGLGPPVKVYNWSLYMSSNIDHP